MASFTRSKSLHISLSTFYWKIIYQYINVVVMPKSYHQTHESSKNNKDDNDDNNSNI
jgi:hypothetical protein